VSEIQYIENGVSNRKWNSLEACIGDLLEPYAEPNTGDLEYMREQISHIKGCLARFIADQNPSMDTLTRVFYADINIVETDD